MPPKRILVLGGTAEARLAAEALQSCGHDVVFSLAGVTEAPLLPAVRVRTGGFGGTEGLAAFIGAERITALLDATHPFAAVMSRQAAEAARATGVPLARIERMAWSPQPGDLWIEVQSVPDAAAALPKGAHAFVTTGRKEIRSFVERDGVSGIIRTIEPPADPLPSGWTLLQDRPPYEQGRERDLMLRNHISHLVTKNAGGASTVAKLVAARTLQIPVIMVARPIKPDCLVFPDVQSILDGQVQWLGSAAGRP